MDGAEGLLTTRADASKNAAENHKKLSKMIND